MKENISIVVPCHNEQENIFNVYQNITQNLPVRSGQYELIFVNDGSDDDTAQEVKSLQEENSSVKLVNLKTNSGYGAAVRAGFAAAGYDYIFYIDGDRQYDFSDADKMLDLLVNKKMDIVTPYRRERRDSYDRKILMQAGNFLCRLIFGINYKDVNCGFKLFRKEPLKMMQLQCNSAVLFGLEIYLKSKKLNLKLAQIPIAHLKRTAGRAKGINAKQYLLLLSDIFVKKCFAHLLP